MGQVLVVYAERYGPPARVFSCFKKVLPYICRFIRYSDAVCIIPPRCRFAMRFHPSHRGRQLRPLGKNWSWCVIKARSAADRARLALAISSVIVVHRTGGESTCHYRHRRPLLGHALQRIFMRMRSRAEASAEITIDAITHTFARVAGGIRAVPWMRERKGGQMSVPYRYTGFGKYEMPPPRRDEEEEGDGGRSSMGLIASSYTCMASWLCFSSPPLRLLAQRRSRN